MFLTVARRQLAEVPLLRIEALLDWRPLRLLLVPIDALVDDRRGGPEGYTALSLFCALLLGVWYSLGFEALAAALRVRLDFQLFASLDPTAPTPAASTLFRFRRRLDNAGCYSQLLDEVDRQLRSHGVELRLPDGALLDIRIRTLRRHPNDR